MKFRIVIALLLAFTQPALAQFQPGDRVVFVGDGLAKREGLFGYFEMRLHARFPKLGLTFRNLAYTADTPAVHLGDILKGDNSDSNRESNRALNFGTMHKHLNDAKADVILVCFGMTDSFQTKAPEFIAHLEKLLGLYAEKKYNGKSPPRFVLVGPIAHENLGGEFPNPEAHNKDLAEINTALAQLAKKRNLPFVDLFTPSQELMQDTSGDRLTFNGIHLTAYGYWALAQKFAEQFPVDQVAAHFHGLAMGLNESTSLSFPVPPPPQGAKVHRSLEPRLLHVQLRKAEPKTIYHLVVNDQSCEAAPGAEWMKGRLLHHTPMQLEAEALRQNIVARNKEFFDIWRAVNGEYVYGRRAKPFGVVNFPGEMVTFQKLVAELDVRIAKLVETKKSHVGQFLSDEAVKARKIPSLARFAPEQKNPETAEVYKQKQGLIGSKEFPTARDPQEALKFFKLQEGYEINLFASEKDFPLHDPLAMAWDAKGRLWVTTMPSYPHNIPGVPPNDKIIILEDTDGDGKADKHTVFADGLYLPTGIEFGNGGVYVGAQPNLLFLKDTDGDDKADTREIVLHGMGTGDSHHAVHAFTWGPDGGLLLHEGVFHRSNIETPFGPVRQHDAGIYRFQPRSHKLETLVSYGFANPWGHVFDRWGQNFVADASGGANYFGLPFTGEAAYPRQHPGMKVFTSVVRPTCGCEIISSRHFPESAQGNFLVNNNIGFQGIKQHRVLEEASGFTSKEEPPLLFSTDPNFRPVGIGFGPDGALYVVDWYNPLIGHMQFSLRDPGRDHYHGRIWRITAKGRPLVARPKIAGQPIPAVLDLLKVYEDRTRYWVRGELRDRPKAEVVAAVPTWIAGLKEEDPQHEHHLLEALWVYQSVGHVEPNLLKRLLRAKDYHARAAATRALRHWRDQIPEALDLFADQVNDIHPRVRLEAVVALSFYKNEKAAKIALETLKHPMDYYLDYGLKETMVSLETYWKSALEAGKAFAGNNPAGANYLLAGVSTGALVKMQRTMPVYLALLTRDNVPPQYRQEALEGLAKINKTDVLTELLAALDRLDKGSGSENVLHDLGHLLTARKKDDLVKIQPHLEKMAAAAKMSHTRQVAFVTLVTAEGSLDRTWAEASRSLQTLRDLVDAIAYLPDPKLRTSSYARVNELLQHLPPELEKQAKAGTLTPARFVRIELPGNKRTLTLAEVQVFAGGANVAPQGKAKQSSTAYGGSANKAIDRNTSGAFKDGGQTHTAENESKPWWELDLGKDWLIDSIAIHNRSEENGKYASRLDGMKLTVLDGHRQPIFTKELVKAPATSQKFVLDADPGLQIRLAAIHTLATIPGHEAETFATLSGLIRQGKEREAGVRALRLVPRGKWPASEIKPLADFVVTHVQKIPPQERTELAVLDLLQLGNQLAGALAPAEAKNVRALLGELGVRVIYLRTLPHKMVYDRSKIYVQAGKPAVIVLDNTDIMPHNLLISKPGSLAEIGIAAEKMSTDPNAFAKGFIPDSKKVLWSTRMLQPRESERLSFVAPTEPGEYVFVCTFPGHWRLMNGILHVVPDLSKISPEELDPPPVPDDGTPTRAFVRNWAVDDLSPDLINVGNNRDFARGKELFKATTCFQCHKMGNDGGNLGPNLAEVPKKLTEGKLTRIGLLNEILEPSKTIADQYKPWVIVTNAGQVITGVIVEKQGKILKIQNNPLEKAREVNEDDIEEKKESVTSLMPNGLLVTLDKDEIFDLLAYIVAGGDANHPAFRKQ